MVVAAVTRRLELRVLQAHLLAARGLILLAEPAQLDVHALKLGVHPQPAQLRAREGRGVSMACGSGVCGGGTAAPARYMYACLLTLVSVERPQLVVFTEPLLGLLVGPLDLVVPRERHLWEVGGSMWDKREVGSGVVWVRIASDTWLPSSSSAAPSSILRSSSIASAASPRTCRGRSGVSCGVSGVGLRV